MAGDNTKAPSRRHKDGDAIHVFKGGSIQMLTTYPLTSAGTFGREQLE